MKRISRFFIIRTTAKKTLLEIRPEPPERPALGFEGKGGSSDCVTRRFPDFRDLDFPMRLKKLEG